MKPGKILIVIGLLVWISGCYTQFATVGNRYPADQGVAEGDSTIERSKDTVVVKEREMCYWHRTFFGDWELRCYETNYSDNWYSYYHRPWWYQQSSYYMYNCSCPYHISYHAGCDYCWYYCNKYNSYFNHHPHIPGKNTTGTGIVTGTPVTTGKKQGRPPVRPPGSSGSSGKSTGVSQQGSSIIVIGEDEQKTKTVTDTKIEKGLYQGKKARPQIHPLPKEKKKETILSGDKSTKVKNVPKGKPVVSKPTIKEKAVEIKNSEPVKKEQIKTKKQRSRKRRSLRGK